MRPEAPAPRRRLWRPERRRPELAQQMPWLGLCQRVLPPLPLRQPSPQPIRPYGQPWQRTPQSPVVPWPWPRPGRPAPQAERSPGRPAYAEHQRPLMRPQKNPPPKRQMRAPVPRWPSLPRYLALGLVALLLSLLPQPSPRRGPPRWRSLAPRSRSWFGHQRARHARRRQHYPEPR